MSKYRNNVPKLDPDINDKCTPQHFCMYFNFSIKIDINNINLLKLAKLHYRIVSSFNGRY